MGELPALEVGGITAATPDPADGRIERDPDGSPTGTLHEGAAYTAQRHRRPEPDPQEWVASVLEGQAHLHALGITGWQDAWVTPATLPPGDAERVQGCRWPSRTDATHSSWVGTGTTVSLKV